MLRVFLLTCLIYVSFSIALRGLPIERARHRRKGQPLCMEQYYRLFTSYREPGKTSDNQVTNLQPDPFDPEHIVVACRDQVSFPIVWALCSRKLLPHFILRPQP